MIYLEIKKEFGFIDSQSMWSELEDLGFSVNYDITESGTCIFYLKVPDMIKFILRKRDLEPFNYYTYSIVYKNSNGVIPITTRTFVLSRIIQYTSANIFFFPYILPEGYKGSLEHETFVRIGLDTVLNVSRRHKIEDVYSRLSAFGFKPEKIKEIR